MCTHENSKKSPNSDILFRLAEEKEAYLAKNKHAKYLKRTPSDLRTTSELTTL